MSWSSTIIAGRVLLLGAAAGAVVAGFWASRPARDQAVAARGSYACPMHPDVKSSSPGDCPICRMALEPVAAAKAASPPATFTLPEGAELRRFGAVDKVGNYEAALEMRAPAWAENAATGVVLFHLDESQLIERGEEAIFFPSSRPKDGVPPGIKVFATGDPPRKWDHSTALVRFRAKAFAKLLPGQTGSIKFATRLRTGLVVRSSAVLDSPGGPFVLVVADDRRTLTRRPVVIGTVNYGYAAVIAGLRAGEDVAAAQAFFLDAERRLRGGAP